jgi:hypothetical protein
MDSRFIAYANASTKIGDFGGGVPPALFNCHGSVDGKDKALSYYAIEDYNQTPEGVRIYCYMNLPCAH